MNRMTCPDLLCCLSFRHKVCLNLSDVSALSRYRRAGVFGCVHGCVRDGIPARTDPNRHTIRSSTVHRILRTIRHIRNRSTKGHTILRSTMDHTILYTSDYTIRDSAKECKSMNSSTMGYSVCSNTRNFRCCMGCMGCTSPRRCCSPSRIPQR